MKLSMAQGSVFLVAMATLIVFLGLGFTPFRAVTLSLGTILFMSPWSKDTRLDVQSTRQALLQAAKAGLPLIAAAACVGVVLGVVTLTGIGSRLPGAILPLAQENRLAALFLLMISTIILGMGLPSAVCYLLMATLIGPVLTKLGLVPLAAHLFIFYFGMMSMVTPPVALAAYTAAAIANADVMRTSLVAFRLALVGFLLPYAFVLNPSLLLLPTEQGSLLTGLLFVTLGLLFLATSTAGFFIHTLAGPIRILLFASALVVILIPPISAWTWTLNIAGALVGLLLIALNARPRIARTVCLGGGVA